MKQAYTYGALAALAYGSAIAAAAVLPERSRPSSKAHIIDVNRNWDVVNAWANRGCLKRSTSGLSTLDYSGYWYANITVGGEHCQVVLDTGSADLWLVNPDAGSSATKGIETWNPSTASDTTKMPGYKFDIAYGEGGNGVSGPVYKSDVCLGRACTTMAVGSATTVANISARSGIMGMAFKGGNSITPNKQETFMEELAPSLNSPIFVTKFSDSSGTSQIAFGDNPFRYSGSMQRIKAQSTASDQYPYSWSFSNITYSKNGKELGTFNVVFDTGGPMTSSSDTVVRGYYDGINGAKDVNGDATSWTVPCGTTLPDLKLQLGSASLIIPGHRFYHGNKAKSGDCVVWFVKDNSPTRGLVGDPFFDSHVVVFNQEESTIQWAKQS